MSEIYHLSALNREKSIHHLQNTEFDLLVIGGGITGAGIALDAASRGLKVALVEKKDFASGTSSRSTKLIHGGLRYLKQLEIGLVKEVGMERAIVHRLAPHLVTSEKMLLPLIKGGTFGKFSTSMALKVYDFLAGVVKEDQRVMLDASKTMQAEPLLQEDIVKGGGLYAEYRTDDARLTIEIIKTAARYGAISLNYAEAEDFIYENNKICGAICKDNITGQSFEIKSKYVVSAAGPWVDKLRKVNQSLSGKHLFLTKGVHIVVPYEKLPLQQSMYFDVPDGRMIFAIPRHRVTYIGTTDTPYDGDINHVLTNMVDVQYLLDAVNNMFPDIELVSADVESSWAGLRPLIHEEGKSASELSRKDEIFVSDTNLISIAGGKLTGYRKMSERIVDLVCKQYKKESDKDFPNCKTDDIVLNKEAFKNANEVANYTSALAEQLDKKGLSKYYAQYLVANYGKQTDAILKKMSDFADEQVEVRLIRAELWFCVQQELVCKVDDFFNRRTGRLYFNLPSIETLLPNVLADMKTYFAWDDAKSQTEQKRMLQEIKEACHFE